MTTSFQSTAFPLEQETPVLLQDLARVFRQLGVQFVRASVVDMSSMAFQAAWTIADSGDISDSPTDRAMDSVFPGAAASVGTLLEAPTDHTLVQKLSPRRWAFAWRLDARNAVVAEAQYRERRDAVSEIDTALVRLVCSASIRRGDATPVAGSEDPNPMLAWPHVERRARPQTSVSAWATVSLAALAGLLALWVALWAGPRAEAVDAEQQAQVTAMRAMADATMVSGLSIALSSGDYGEAQTELSQFLQLGYFQSAVVTNAKGRIVAMDGKLEQLRIGDAVTPAYTALARPLDLALGSEKQGQLLLVSGPASGRAPHGLLQGAAALAGLAALATAGLLALRLRGRR